MLIKFTPKKFIDTMEVNGIKLTELVEMGLYRSYFIPRYKPGSKRKEELGDYKKGLRLTTIKKIAATLVEFGYFDDKDAIVKCFLNDDFERLVPEDLL